VIAAKVTVNEANAPNPLPRLSDFERDWNTTAFLPDAGLTFPAVLGERISRCSEEPAFFDAVVGKDGIRAAPHSLGEIHTAARRAAFALETANVRAGDRVLLCVGSTASFLSFLLGAQAIGAIPVPLPCPADFRARSAFRERITSVSADCEPRAIVMDSIRETESFAELAIDVPAIGSSEQLVVDAPTVSSFSLHRSFHEIAFIQYTSGSTGSPKGVVVTHYNLVANMRAISEAAGFGPGERSFNWLPLYHDMGLVGGFLIGLYIGIPTFVMPPRIFVGKPDSWLRCMSEFRATFACAPNFAYNMLARRCPDSALAGLDLSNWRLAFNGAEPIDRATVEDFMNRFASVGLSAGTMFPVYGMAECTLAAAFPPPRALPRYDFVDRHAIARERRATVAEEGSPSALCCTSVGRALPGHSIRIVEPQGTKELAERHVGEVVVEGPSITPFYFQKHGPSQRQRAELRTGDLGYVADGHLYIVDRLKDLLIIGGRNIVPSDVERVAARVAGVRYGAVVAFAKPGPAGTDELYVVAGVESKADRALVDRQIRTAVLEYFGIVPKDVMLVKPSAIPKTSSGKVRRVACREMYDTGAFAGGAGEDASA